MGRGGVVAVGRSHGHVPRRPWLLTAGRARHYRVLAPERAPNSKRAENPSCEPWCVCSAILRWEFGQTRVL